MPRGALLRLLGRIKSYYIEYKASTASMPNPPWYKEEEKIVTLERLSKLPLSTHLRVWREAWVEYSGSLKQTFGTDSGLGGRKEAGGGQEKIEALKSIISSAAKATHNTPEDIEKSKVAVRELMREVKESRHDLRQMAEEKLELVKVSLSEFSAGYREERDKELKRVLAMDSDLFKGFFKERLQEAKHAVDILTDKVVDNAELDPRTMPANRDAATDANTNKGRDEGEREAAALAATAAPTRSSGAAVGAPGQPRSAQNVVVDDNETGLTGLFSAPVRETAREVLHDPDVERLVGRAGSFLQGRVKEAAAAGEVLLRGEGDGDDGGKGGGGSSASKGGGEAGGQHGATPRVDKLVKDARDTLKEKAEDAGEAIRVLMAREEEVEGGERGEAEKQGGEDRRSLRKGKEVREEGRGGEEDQKG